MRTSLKYTVALLFLFAVNLTAQTTYYVDIQRPDDDGDGSSWATAKQLLQSAIALAAYGDQIWVAAGTYSAAFNVGNGIQIYGGFSGSEEGLEERNWGDNETILTNPGGTVVIFESVSEATVLDGFTITGGNTSDGGGIYNQDGSPQISNCTIIDNSASGKGGGMYNYGKYSTAIPSLTNCTIIDNSARYGGGMYNYAERAGAEASAILINCIITSNSASKDGGGIYNQALNSTSTASPRLINCLITGNSAEKGGGMYNNGEYGTVSASPNFTNCTISGNLGSYQGGGMYNYKGNPTFTNCIIWGNEQSDRNDRGFPSYYNSDIEGSGGSDNWSNRFGTNGGYNIDTDPWFFS